MQLALDMVDKALTSKEATKVYINTLIGAHYKINQMISCGASFVDTVERSQIPSVVALGSGGSNYYNEQS